MARDPIRRKYSQQRCAAKRRGIDFHFTLQEWVLWWETHLGSDWLKYRGCRPNDYVMARRGDVGPYHPDNVLCMTLEENSRQALIHKPNKGVLNGNASLNEAAVTHIRSSSLTADDLAKIYSVSATTIWRIKKGITYR